MPFPSLTAQQSSRAQSARFSLLKERKFSYKTRKSNIFLKKLFSKNLQLGRELDTHSTQLLLCAVCCVLAVKSEEKKTSRKKEVTCEMTGLKFKKRSPVIEGMGWCWNECLKARYRSTGKHVAVAAGLIACYCSFKFRVQIVERQNEIYVSKVLHKSDIARCQAPRGNEEKLQVCPS